MNPYSELAAIPSAWKGHEHFAAWLVNEIRPEVSVDLGVDYGYSLFSLAVPGIGEVYGIDSFEGDAHAGHRTDTYDSVIAFKNRHSFNKVHVIKGQFAEVAKTWSLPIDILHIDGLHTYDAVRADWGNWNPFVRDGGVTIMHDVISFPEVGQFFNELTLPKVNFVHSAGLGVVTSDQALLTKILNVFPNCKFGNV